MSFDHPPDLEPETEEMGACMAAGCLAASYIRRAEKAEQERDALLLRVQKLQKWDESATPPARAEAPRTPDACVEERTWRTIERRVVCAAIRAADGGLLLGIRHYSEDMHAQIKARVDGGRFMHRHDQDQGFVDQRGVFMSREEAYEVALLAGQIRDKAACGQGLDGPKLYSEGLY